MSLVINSRSCKNNKVNSEIRKKKIIKIKAGNKWKQNKKRDGKKIKSELWRSNKMDKSVARLIKKEKKVQINTVGQQKRAHPWI